MHCLYIHVDNAYHIGKKNVREIERIDSSPTIWYSDSSCDWVVISRETIKALRKDVTVMVVIFP
jgi:translation elongation factor EF-4